MPVSRSIAVLCCALLCPILARAAESFGENLVQLKLALPKGETYVRGASDPVLDLLADLTLVNLSAKENLNPESTTLKDVQRLSGEELEEIAALLKKDPRPTDEIEAKLKSLEKEKQSAPRTPANKDSLGVAYVEPQLGPHDSIDFVIVRLPEEGEAVPENAKPALVPRDNRPDQITRVDLANNKYLAAGTTSPVYSLPVGRYYQIRQPGMYSIKAVMRLIGDSSKPSRVAESNEEKFRVLPFKSVDRRIEDLRENWAFYERGEPGFDYHLYQVQTSEPHGEVYSVQRITVRGETRWEWKRICSVYPETTAQVAFSKPHVYYLGARHASGGAGLYTLDFSSVPVKVKVELKDIKGDAAPKLKVEGGAATFE